ncbi:MAG: toprim domain-containing protein [Candidatus Bathyarchaeia archaeon]
MRAPANVRLERLEKILEQLSNESEKGNPIIVEGSKDKNALRAIGITGTILCLQSSRLNPLEFVEELGDLRHAIVLTDFDRQGVSLAHRLSRTLNSRGTLGNIIIWRSLRELTRSNLRSIEELPGYRDKLRLEVQNPNDTFPHKFPPRDQPRKVRR